MTDRYSNHASSLESPAQAAFSITPNDNAQLAEITRAIYIGAPGDLALIMQSGDEVTFHSAPAGLVLPVRAARIKATGTTAGNLVGMV